MRGFFRVASVVCLVARLSAASYCRADDRVALEWNAPDECPNASGVLERVRRDADVASGDRPVLRVRGAVTREGGFVLDLEVDGRHERWIEAISCDELASAAAFVIAMALDSRAQSEAAPAEVLPAVAAEVPPAVVVDESPEVSEGRAWRAAVRFEGEFAYGGVPMLAGGARVSAGIEGASWNVEASLRWLPNASKTVVAAPRVGATFELLSAVVSGGGAVTWGPVRVEFVLGFELGKVSGTAFGLSQPGTGSSFWFAIDGGARVRYRWMERLGLFVGLDASVPVSRADWRIDGYGVVARISPMGMSARVGGEFVF